MIRLSFIIPVYNAASYLRECLDSILSQVDDSCEVICVDDGSTDGSYDILQEYPMVRTIRKQNGGVSSARNRGIEEAKGEYIWFVDADDIIVNGAISFLRATLQRNTPDIFAFNWFRLKDGGTIPGIVYGTSESFDMSCKKQAIAALDRLGGLLWAYNGLYRKSALDGLCFENFTNGEDMLFGYGALFKAKSLVVADVVLYGYRDNPSGASRTMSERHLRSIMQVALRLDETFRTTMHSDWFAKRRLKHINGIMCTWGIIIADKLGKKGYDIWRETACKLYHLGLMRLLVALKWDKAIYLSTIGIVKIKQNILKLVRG